MIVQQDNDERQGLVRYDSDSDLDNQQPLNELDRARLMSFFQQNSVEMAQVAAITKEMYKPIKRLDVMDAADSWAFTKENNIRKLYTRMFVHLVVQTYDYLTVINLSHLAEFENASIYSDVHNCYEKDSTEVYPSNRSFDGTFLRTGMIRALARCKQLEKISLCGCLVPIERDVELAHIFQANKNLVLLRLMGIRLTGQCLLSIRKPEDMASLFIVNCRVDRKPLLLGLRRMKKLSVLSMASTEICRADYTPTQLQISKFMKSMWLDWFEVWSDYLPLFLFEKQRLNCLSVLSIDHVGSFINDNAIKYIADNCKRLRVFSSRECWDVSGQGFVPIFKLPRLRYIDVSRTSVTDEAVLEEVSRDLRVLICHQCHFTSEGLKILVQQLDNIEVIDAHKCSEVDNDFVAYLYTYAKNRVDRRLVITARVSRTGVNLMQRADFILPIDNLRLIIEENEHLEADYRTYLADRIPERR